MPGLQEFLHQVQVEPLAGLQVGDEIEARARVHIGALQPEDVRVEFYLGDVDTAGEIVEAEPTAMEVVEAPDAETIVVAATAVPCCRSGLHGYSVRVLPDHPDLTTRFLPGLITWYEPERREG